MKISNFLILIFFACFLNLRCIAVKYHNYAVINNDIAIKTIQKLKVDTLLIVIPTFRKKEALLKRVSKRGLKNRKQNKLKLINLYAERQILQEALIHSFLDNYTFSQMLFIPDSLVSQLESGVIGSYFLNEDARIDSTIRYSNSNPIKLIQQFDQEWQIKIGNEIIPNPFPNYYLYRNGLYGFLGDETYEKMYERVSSTFQKRFDQFYKNPNRRVYL